MPALFPTFIATAALLVLTACGPYLVRAPPRPLPSAPWTRGAAMWLHTDPRRDPSGQADDARPYAEEDLRSAGIQIGNQPGALEVVLEAIKGKTGTFDITVLRDGRQVDKIAIDNMNLPCHTPSGLGGVIHSDACVGREIAVRLIESPAVAAAVGLRAPAPAAVSQKQLSGKLAVLDLRNFAKDLTKENAQYFTDLVRSVALKTQPQLEVMTRENLVVLLQASGKDLASCEGECEVDTGRRIGADLIVSGEIQKLGTLYKLSLRLHDTHRGRLLASDQASAKSVEELDQGAQRAAAELLGGR